MKTSPRYPSRSSKFAGRLWLALCLILPLFALAFLVGCGATPNDKLRNADRTYIVVTQAAKAAVVAGAVPYESLDALAVADDEAYRALKAAHDRNASTQPVSDIDFWTDRAIEAVNRYAELYAKTKASK